jgi:hypothetical protein
MLLNRFQNLLLYLQLIPTIDGTPVVVVMVNEYDFEKIYEDSEVLVVKGVTIEELTELVYNYIKSKGRPVTTRELRRVFSGIAGEDRLRRALNRLRMEGRIITISGKGHVAAELLRAKLRT